MSDRAPDAPLSEVEWRVQGKIDRGDGVTVVAYLDGPTVSRLLDEWVGPFRWADAYEPTGKQGSMWCHLSVADEDGTWITKTDLGVASDMEADKGLVSDAFKRVAMRKWRVGANVFDLPVLRITQFRKVERQGKDPMAYLTDESHAEIARLLKAQGFDEAADQTKVRGSAGPDTSAVSAAMKIRAAAKEHAVVPAVSAYLEAEHGTTKVDDLDDEAQARLLGLLEDEAGREYLTKAAEA